MSSEGEREGQQTHAVPGLLCGLNQLLEPVMNVTSFSLPLSPEMRTTQWTDTHTQRLIVVMHYTYSVINIFSSHGRNNFMNLSCFVILTKVLSDTILSQHFLGV